MEQQIVEIKINNEAHSFESAHIQHEVYIESWSAFIAIVAISIRQLNIKRVHVK